MNKFLSEFKKILNNKNFIFLWLLAISILNFGILIPALHFYWDDLPYLYQYSAFGPEGFPAYVASDRPFSAWIFSMTTALFGYASIGYHILILILRWVCSALFYMILREIWPEKRMENTIAATIFAVYPGFLQQPVALIYNHHFSVFALFLASVFLMTINLKGVKPKIILLLVSTAMAFSMFSIENFAMLELIRPFIIWKIVSKREVSTRGKLRTTMLYWFPYLAVFSFFIIWRVFILKFPTYKPMGIAGFFEAPFKTLANILARIPGDFFTVYIHAWAIDFYIPIVSEFGRIATYLFWAVTTTTIGLAIAYFLMVENDQAEQPSNIQSNGKWDLLTASILLFILAGLIVWGLDLPVENDFAWDRMTLAFIPGVALLGACICSLLKKVRGVQTILMTIIMALAVSQNYQYGISFKRDGDNLQDFLTQLSWRIPALADNTIFITSLPGLKYYSDNSLVSPVNLQYAGELASNELKHFVYYTNARTEDWFENDEYDRAYKKRYRSFIFTGNTGNAITYRFNPPSCVQILDWKYANSVTTPNMTDRQVKEIRFSNLDLILESPEYEPFKPLFSSSETGSWCYYFEKADLARQFGKYEEIVRLGELAFKEGKTPRTPSEWLPFLEGYLWEGDFERAEMIIQEIIGAEGNYSAGMCYTLNRINREREYPHSAPLQILIKENQCGN